MSSTNALTGSITSEDVLGKDIIDPNGEFIGVSDKLLLDPKTLTILGISVDKGFLKKGLIIGTDYIGEITPHAILLKKRLHIRVNAMKVYGSEGASIGRVRSHEVDGDGQLTQITVRSSMISNEIHIPSKYIEHIENSILLNITKTAALALTQ